MKKLMLAAGLSLVAFVVAPIATANAGKFVGACVIHGKAEFGAKIGINGALVDTTYKFKSTATLGVETTVCTHLALGKAEELAKDLREDAEFAAKQEEDKTPPIQTPTEDVTEDIKAVEKAVTEGEAQEVKATAEVEGHGDLGCVAASGGFEPDLAEPFGDKDAGEAAGTGNIKVGGAPASVFGGFKFTSTGTQVHFVAGGPPATAAGEASFAKDVFHGAECTTVGPTELEFDAVTAGVIG